MLQRYWKQTDNTRYPRSETKASRMKRGKSCEKTLGSNDRTGARLNAVGHIPRTRIVAPEDLDTSVGRIGEHWQNTITVFVLEYCQVACSGMGQVYEVRSDPFSSHNSDPALLLNLD